MNTFKLAILDWDGTLADTIPIQHRAARAVFKANGLTPPNMVRFFREYQVPFAETYRKFGVTFSEKEMWSLYNAACDRSKTRLFADSLESVIWLKSLMLVTIVSAAPQGELHSEVHRLGVREHVSKIRCGSDHKLSAVSEVLESYGCPASEAFFLSDMASDLETVRPSGIVLFGITRGMSDARSLRKAGAVRNFPNLMALKAHIARQGRP